MFLYMFSLSGLGIPHITATASSGTLRGFQCVMLQSSVMGSRTPAPLDWQQLMTLLDSTLDGALTKVRYET
jgi:hypothetical protein